MASADAFLDELIRTSDALDRLIADRSARQPSQTRHEEHVDQAEKLADRLRAIGRGSGRPVNPPIGRTAHGYAW